MNRKIEITNTNIHDLFFSEGIINSESDDTKINFIQNSIYNYGSKFMQMQNGFSIFNVQGNNEKVII